MAARVMLFVLVLVVRVRIGTRCRRKSSRPERRPPGPDTHHVLDKPSAPTTRPLPVSGWPARLRRLDRERPAKVHTRSFARSVPGRLAIQGRRAAREPGWRDDKRAQRVSDVRDRAYASRRLLRASVFRVPPSALA